eukprot:12360186-Ditylum_brightwellii.AAC.1
MDPRNTRPPAKPPWPNPATPPTAKHHAHAHHLTTSTSHHTETITRQHNRPLDQNQHQHITPEKPMLAYVRKPTGTSNKTTLRKNQMHHIRHPTKLHTLWLLVHIVMNTLLVGSNNKVSINAHTWY